MAKKIVIAILVGIGVFRASGAMDMVIQGISWSVEQCGLNADFVGALPTAIMKPLSGSGARGMMLEAMKNYGPDSFVGRLSAMFRPMKSNLKAANFNGRFLYLR